MKVIVAVDDSAYSKEVIAELGRRHWPEDAEFRVLTVLEPLEYTEDQLDDIIRGVNEKRRQHAEQLCQSARARLETTIPGARVHYEIRSGAPMNEIINAAVEWQAEKILVGAHGKRGCPYNLVGSVSRTVATHAPCCVEIIRIKESRKKPVQKETLAAAEA